eukprot:1180454-Amphidinium_carterae.1
MCSQSALTRAISRVTDQLGRHENTMSQGTTFMLAHFRMLLVYPQMLLHQITDTVFDTVAPSLPVSAKLEGFCQNPHAT